MKAVLSLKNPLWNSPQRKQLLDQVVQKSAAELEGLVKRAITDSTARGRLYRRGAITKKATNKNLPKGLRRVAGNVKKVIVGSKFHRASAPGQPPASDSGALVNAIRASKIEILRARVNVGVNYGDPLDKGATINNRSSRTKIAGPFLNRTIAPRPFFAVTVEKFKDKFKQNLSEAIAGTV